MKRRETILGTGTVLLATISGCGDLEESSEASGPGEAAADEDEANPEPPNYTTVETDDISFGDVVRLRIQVRPGDPVDDLSDEEFLAISEEIVNDTTDEQDVNSITIFFWEANAEIGAETAYARVTWAPDGDLSAANTVSTGDYSEHDYDLEFLKEWMEEEEEIEESELPASEVVSRIEDEGIEVTFASDDYGPLIIETPTPTNHEEIEDEVETIALVYADAYSDGYRAKQLTGRLDDNGTTTHMYYIYNEWVEGYLSDDLSEDDYSSQVLSMIEPYEE